MSREYAEGYKNALENADKYLTKKINENGGARSPLQILNVFNDFVFYLHNELSELNQELREEDTSSEDELIEYDELEEVLRGLGFELVSESKIKGGIK